MAIIQELRLFSWKDFQDDLQNLGDLERLQLVIKTIPDEKLIQTLHSLRANGRNDHPADLYSSLTVELQMGNALRQTDKC